MEQTSQEHYEGHDHDQHHCFDQTPERFNIGSSSQDPENISESLLEPTQALDSLEESYNSHEDDYEPEYISDYEYYDDDFVEYDSSSAHVSPRFNQSTYASNWTDDFLNHLYRCYPLSFAGKSSLEHGNQIIMPASALDILLCAGPLINYPMLFEMRNEYSGHVSHCGVSEFTAEEGLVFLPNWMMKNLQLKEGDFVNLKSVNLERGTYMKLQPHSCDFLDLSDPKAVLESFLSKNIFCLTTGDTILINHNNKDFYIDIVETKPSSAISIVNTDCEVDFAAPLDYKEPEKLAKPVKEGEAAQGAKPKLLPFSGLSRRLDGNSSMEPDTNSVRKEHPKSVAFKCSERCLGMKSAAKPDSSSAQKEHPKLLPFTGLGRRLDGKSSLESDVSAVQKENPTADAVVARVGENVAKGNLKEDVTVETSTKQQFQPFTGRKYSLRG